MASPRLAVVVLVLALATVSAFEADDLAGLLPDGKEEFLPDPEGPYFYLSPEDLTEIYNGGYMTYVDRGVVSAASQVYARDSDFYQVVIHDMNSLENASAIVGYFHDLFSGGQATINEIDLGDGGFDYMQFGMSYIYFRLSDLFVTLEGSEGAASAMNLASREVVTRAIPEIVPTAFLAGLVACVGRGRRVRQ